MRGPSWEGPVMYTHVCGYKFSINIYNQFGYLCVAACILPGEYDSQLKWPCTVQMTIELIHQHGRRNHAVEREIYLAQRLG